LHLKVGILVHLLLYLYLVNFLKAVPGPNVCFPHLQTAASFFVQYNTSLDANFDFKLSQYFYNYYR
jgi:hypothetical protein